MTSSGDTIGSPTLVVEASAATLRGVLFSRVEGQSRFVTDATCHRGPSLSEAVEEIATALARRTGFASRLIQREPRFVLSEPDDLANPSLHGLDRTQAIAQCCSAIAIARDVAVTYIEALPGSGQITVVRAEPAGRPLVVSTPTSALAEDSLEALIEDGRRTRQGIDGSIDLVIAAEPFASLDAGAALLALADIVGQEAGTLDIAFDRDGLTPAIGSLDVTPASIVDDLMLPFCTMAIIEGDGVPGTLAVRSASATQHGTARRVSLPWGSVARLRAPSWDGATVVCAGQRGATIGGKPIMRLDLTPANATEMFLDARGSMRWETPGTALRVAWSAEVLES